MWSGMTERQSDSENVMLGVVPPAVLQEPRFKLLVSPVVPALATHLGAAVDPSASFSDTVTLAPLLKSAREPPASPTTFHSLSCQTDEMSSTLSLAVMAHTVLPNVTVVESLPPGLALALRVIFERSVIGRFVALVNAL